MRHPDPGTVRSCNERQISEFRANGGTSGIFGRNLILLHTVGARSGELRLVPAVGFRTEHGWLVVAANSGSPRHPAWYHNLAAHPRLTLEAPAEPVGIELLEVVAVELRDSAYAAAWQDVISRYPVYAEYAATTQVRRIPIIRLAPAQVDS